jgi:hypothetical protein
MKKINPKRYIQVTFRDGRQATYTDAVLNMMMYDNDVVEIIDAETGEVLKA